MSAITKTPYLFMLFFVIIGCENTGQQEKPRIETVYGLMEADNDSLGVELELEKFKNWKAFFDRVELIACHDSLPKITLKTRDEINTIYFRNICWKAFSCYLIRPKNVIEIHDDSLSKADDFVYPLDSLESVMLRDLENNGKNPNWSDSPEKLLFFISYDKNNLENLPSTLLQLIQTYKRLTNRTDILVLLNNKMQIVPPPPPPPASKHILEVD